MYVYIYIFVYTHIKYNTYAYVSKQIHIFPEFPPTDPWSNF